MTQPKPQPVNPATAVEGRAVGGGPSGCGESSCGPAMKGRAVEGADQFQNALHIVQMESIQMKRLANL